VRVLLPESFATQYHERRLPLRCHRELPVVSPAHPIAMWASVDPITGHVKVKVPVIGPHLPKKKSIHSITESAA
jgi:hypothetical protein